MSWEYRTFQTTSSAEHRAAVNVDYFSGDKGCQVRGGEENWAGDFLGGADTLQWNWNESAFQSGLGAQHRGGHVGVNPAGRDAIHNDIVRAELGGQSFDEADDRALGGAVVG